MYLENRAIKLAENKWENLLPYNKRFLQIDFLQDDGKYVHGGNGIVFKLTDEQENQDYVIKFSKFPEQERFDDWRIEKRLKRFEREIEALSIATSNELNNIVKIEFSGIHKIDDLDFQYYVMQKCDCTLSKYLSKKENELDIYQKTMLCHKILLGIKGLHEYRIYHRDIKHDNIFFIGNEPYIGDLGLADYRDSDIIINERGDIIGPAGWFSPEAVNKFLVEKSSNRNKYDCRIDEKSEVFQLGKLFWYIFQGNIPIGQIILNDFIPRDKKLFEIVFSMLLYSKKQRIDTENLDKELNAYLNSN